MACPGLYFQESPKHTPNDARVNITVFLKRHTVFSLHIFKQLSILKKFYRVPFEVPIILYPAIYTNQIIS